MLMIVFFCPRLDSSAIRATQCTGAKHFEIILIEFNLKFRTFSMTFSFLEATQSGDPKTIPGHHSVVARSPRGHCKELE